MANFQEILSGYYSLQSFKTDILIPVFEKKTSDFQLYESPLDVPVNESENKIIQSIIQYGELKTYDNTIVNLFEVKLQPNIIIERNRVTVGNIIRKLLLNDAAFVNFIYPKGHQHDWRFSFIFKGLVPNEETDNFDDHETEPKRFTYLLGPNESCRTAAERLQTLGNNPEIKIKDIENAFSVEALSKQFFNTYKIHYEKFINHIISNRGLLVHFNETDREKQARDFVKKMLGRIVFLYFIQKKGWLGVPENKIWGEGNPDFMYNLFQNSKKDTNFYNEYLEPLFYNTLNHPRENDICTINNQNLGKVPFLNGGLFEPDFKNGKLLTFPPELFRNLFDFFNNYNFSIIENDPQNRHIAVDPEMLGHIFENLLEDNKDKGAYYTPKEISTLHVSRKLN